MHTNNKNNIHRKHKPLNLSHSMELIVPNDHPNLPLPQPRIAHNHKKKFIKRLKPAALMDGGGCLDQSLLALQ